MRQAITSFLDRFKKTDSPATESETLSDSVHPRQSDTIYRFFYELAWTKWQQIEIYAVSIALTATVAVIWLAVFTTSKQTPIEIHPERNVYELIRNGFSEDSVNQDQVAKFLIDTLTLLHRVDDNKNPYLPLLRGYVNPEIYEEVENYISENSAQFQTHGIVQNLNITRILNVRQDPETGRISAYVRGYYSTFKEPKSKTTEVILMPYRARVKLEPNVRSQVNSTEFYLFELQEITGDRANQWDIEEGLN